MMLPIFGKIFEVIGQPLKDLTEARKYKKAAQADMLKQLAEAEAKVSIAKAEAEAEILRAKAQRETLIATNQGNWELEMARASNTSWKDEYALVLITVPMLITFATPLVAAFVGTEDMINRIQLSISQGWTMLEMAPEEYWLLIGGAFAATFGLRGLARFWK